MSAIDKTRGQGVNTPWRQLENACKDKVNGSADDRFMSAPFLLNIPASVRRYTSSPFSAADATFVIVSSMPAAPRVYTMQIVAGRRTEKAVDSRAG
jgi:hypothetical protein